MNFDSVAGHFQWMEYAAFGRAMERCRYRHVERLADARKVLLLGEGDGRFLSKLLEANPHAHIDCLDASFWMLNRSSQRIQRERPGAMDRVNFIQADALMHDFSEATYDALVTNFFLDCFGADALERLVPRLIFATKPGAFWLLNDFQRPPHGLRGLRAAIWLKSMYAFFRYSAGMTTRTLTDPTQNLMDAGLQLAERATFSWDLMKSELWHIPVRNKTGHPVSRMAGQTISP